MKHLSTPLPSLLCSHHSSQKEVVICVCMESACSQCGLLCRLCRSSKHSNHQTLSIIQLYQRIAKNRDDEWVAQRVSSGLLTLKEARQRCIKQLANAKSEVVGLFDDCEQHLVRFFTEEENALKGQSAKLGTWKNDILELTLKDTLSTAHTKILVAVGSLHRFSKLAEDFSQGVSQHAKTLKEDECSFANKMASLVRTTKEHLKWPLFHHCFHESPKNFDLALRPIWEKAFSPDLKHPDLETQGRLLTRTGSTAGGYRCGMGATIIDCFPPHRIYGCRLRVATATNKLHFGVAVQRTIVSGDYREGHEDVIRSNGYVHSKSDRQMNNTQTDVTFAMGDVVELRFQTSSMTLRISCREHETSMKVANAPRVGDVYRFVVYLWTEGSAVELLVEN